MNNARKIALITLGCPKNDVDSEVIAGELARNGMELVGTEDADILLVNTCGFIEDARRESIEAILKAVAQKKKGRGKKVFVCGCLSGRYRKQLEKEIPEVDGYFGVEAFEEIGRTFIGTSYCYDESACGNRPLSIPVHSAYLKIADGCDHQCTFCAIPLIKGKYRSRSVRSIVREADLLAGRGVKELILIAQDTTRYGQDLSQGEDITALLKRLVELDGIQWIRLMYAHPLHVTDGLLEMMASEEKICSYLDIPLQHISDQMLRNMGRGMTRKHIEKLINNIRKRVNGVVLRTVFITGFPGETEEMFLELLDFIRETQFERLGAFVYSPEEGTRAFSYKAVNKQTARRRYRQIMDTQRGISEGLNLKWTGRTVPVLVDGLDSRGYHGRTPGDCLEIDQKVRITNNAVVGEIVPVRITRSSAYDLTGICLS